MKRLTLLILVLGFLLFFYGLNSRDFWAPDEGDFAQIVRELDNDLLVPHLNQTPYAEKPPLFYYVTYASKKLFSTLRDETSLRLPSALFALLCLLFFAQTVYRHFGAGQAYAASCILGLSPLFYWQARYLQVDMLFASFLVGSLLAFFRYHQERRGVWLYLFFILMALAFLTKGPLAIVLALPVAFLFLAWKRDFRLLQASQVCVGCAILCAIVVPWYVAVYWREGWPFLYENIIQQNVVRFFDAWSHRRPFYYYFTTLPLDFFPWSLFLPMGLVMAFRECRRSPGTAFFLVWFLWMFFFLSVSSGKISKYMLPALPALTVIVSLTITEERSKYNTVVHSALAFLFFALGIMLLFINVRADLYTAFFRERVLFGVMMLILSPALFYCALRARPRSAFVLLSCAMVAFLFCGNLMLFPKWNTYKSPRPMVEQMKQFTKGKIPWVYYGSMRGVYVYYMGSPAIAIDEHEQAKLQALGSSLAEFFVLTRKRDLPEVQQALGPVTLLMERTVGDTVMVFIGYLRKTS